MRQKRRDVEIVLTALLTAAFSLALFFTSARAMASGDICADLFQTKEPSTSELHRNVITSLRSFEQKAAEAEIGLRNPLSAASVDYIRRATQLSELTAEQATELYNNNLRLLVSRAKAKAEDIVLEDVLQSVSMSHLMTQVYSHLRVLSERTGTELGTTPAKLRTTLKRAIHNTGLETFTLEEIVAIAGLQALADLKSSAFDRSMISKLSDEISEGIGPQIAYRLHVDREPGCCRTAVCNTCPNSFRLKEEVFAQTGKSLNTHLKKNAGEAPKELALFELQRELKILVPEVNW